MSKGHRSIQPSHDALRNRRQLLQSAVAVSTLFPLLAIAGTKASGRALRANDAIPANVAGINGQEKAHVEQQAEVDIAAEPSPRTSLANPQIKYSVPERPYVVLNRGALEIVVVDNRPVDDAVLPGHRAGCGGLGALRHQWQPRNLFAPSYAGLNFEHIIDGSIEMTFECIPRRKTWAHDYLMFFWASYIDRPESLDIHFM